jgi:hypothetical protein
VQAGEWKAVRTAALAYGERDDPRVAATLSPDVIFAS